MLREANLVVEADVVVTDSILLNEGFVLTRVGLQVVGSYKGEPLVGRGITLRMPGGDYNGRSFRHPGLDIPRVGDGIFVSLTEYSPGEYNLTHNTGLFQRVDGIAASIERAPIADSPCTGRIVVALPKQKQQVDPADHDQHARAENASPGLGFLDKDPGVTFVDSPVDYGTEWSQFIRSTVACADLHLMEQR